MSIGRPPRLKRRKAPGPDGVLAELCQVEGLAEEVASLLTAHVQAMVARRFDALYKGAGDRTQLDNWRGMCLLQLLSKVVSLLVNDALRKVSEVILDESQMGFRPMRGCPDTTFVARRVLEEFRVTQALEGDVADGEGVYASFVDLRKAFGSAPRETIWRILSSLGVPPILVALVAHVPSTTALLTITSPCVLVCGRARSSLRPCGMCTFISLCRTGGLALRLVGAPRRFDLCLYDRWRP